MPFRAHATFASTRVGVWTSPAHMTFAEGREYWELRWMSAHPESVYCVVEAVQNAAPERRAPPPESQRRTAPTRVLAVRKHSRHRQYVARSKPVNGDAHSRTVPSAVHEPHAVRTPHDVQDGLAGEESHTLTIFARLAPLACWDVGHAAMSGEPLCGFHR